MNTLLERFETSRNGSGAYWLIDGRHRVLGAWDHGLSEIRGNVLTSDGGQSLRVVPISQITMDPDLQFAEAYKDAKAREISAEFDAQALDPVVLVPIGGMPLERRAELKRRHDNARSTSAIEAFVQGVREGLAEPTAIAGVIEEAGYRVGWHSTNPNEISSVNVLIRIYRKLGEGGLRRTMGIAAHWKGDAKANGAHWIGAMALLVRDGYDEDFTPTTWGRLSEMVPAQIIRQAVGDSTSLGTSTPAAWGAVAYHAARRVRKGARLKPRKPVGKSALQL